MSEKTVKYEIVEVKKTDEETEIDKAITEFKELCRVYNITLNEKSKMVEASTKKLISDIKTQSNALRVNLQKDLDARRYVC